MKARYKEDSKSCKGIKISLGSPVSSQTGEEDQQVRDHPGFKLLGKSIMRNTQNRKFDVVISDKELQNEVVETQVLGTMQTQQSVNAIGSAQQEVEQPQPPSSQLIDSQNLEISDDETSLRQTINNPSISKREEEELRGKSLEFYLNRDQSNRTVGYEESMEAVHEFDKIVKTSLNELAGILQKESQKMQSPKVIQRQKQIKLQAIPDQRLSLQKYVKPRWPSPKALQPIPYKSRSPLNNLNIKSKVSPHASVKSFKVNQDLTNLVIEPDVTNFRSNTTIKDKLIRQKLEQRANNTSILSLKNEISLLNSSPSVLQGEGLNPQSIHHASGFNRKSVKVFEGISQSKKAQMELMRDRAIKRLRQHSTDYRLLPEISMPQISFKAALEKSTAFRLPQKRKLTKLVTNHGSQKGIPRNPSTPEIEKLSCRYYKPKADLHRQIIPLPDSSTQGLSVNIDGIDVADMFKSPVRKQPKLESLVADTLWGSTVEHKGVQSMKLIFPAQSYSTKGVFRNTRSIPVGSMSSPKEEKFKNPVFGQKLQLQASQRKGSLPYPHTQNQLSPINGTDGDYGTAVEQSKNKDMEWAQLKPFNYVPKQLTRYKAEVSEKTSIF